MALQDFTLNLKANADGLDKSIRNVKTWGQNFADSFEKVLRFGTITAIIRAFTKAMYEAIDVVKEFDDAVTDLRKVSDLEGQALDDYTKKLGELGETVARTRKFLCEGV